ncbi:hypothetical protein J4729_02160 [Leisingera sp. HS039]|uniref:hypothetical protein n=1 Tax=unclassified Leisingera TaxID=2614906 RepID=UPI0010708BD6|nr:MULTISPECIES: hypothetical protein [unclassified Leisingera]MBQ4823361.1 hypothetical protein [Leisingera sp. HS039]QBR38181.1 hypothetical protein ETW23_20820 [Leisingera sp. NJS201]
MSKHEVWGFAIETSPSGKNIWPFDLKREATRRIREDGLSPGDIAAELGAHECLVRKWWVADRPVEARLLRSKVPRSPKSRWSKKAELLRPRSYLAAHQLGLRASTAVRCVLNFQLAYPKPI